MFNWLHRVFNLCKHDYVVTAIPYIDKSWKMTIPSTRYYAICPKCGDVKDRMYIWGCEFSSEEIKSVLDKGRLVGKKFRG